LANEPAEPAAAPPPRPEPVAKTEPDFQPVSATPQMIEPQLLESPSATGSPLQRRVALPLWMAALLGALLLALAISGIVLLRSQRDSAGPSSASRASDRSTASRTQGERASGASRGDSLLDRARSGEDAALKELAARPSDKRSVAEALALASGRAEQKRRNFASLRERIGKNPALLEKLETARQLLEFARDADTTDDALAAIAELPAPHAADLLFDVWTRTPGRTRATEIAEELVLTEPIRSKASPALLVALDLRRLKTCDEAPDVLSRVKAHGDKRSLTPLGRLTKRTGCGAKKAGDCWACLRDGTALNDALAAAKRRPGPRF
jgi:hypothetical protein